MTIDIWASLWLFIKPVLLYVALPAWTLVGIGYLIGRVAQAVARVVSLLKRGG
jgi:hypothetical protein